MKNQRYVIKISILTLLIFASCARKASSIITMNPPDLTLETPPAETLTAPDVTPTDLDEPKPVVVAPSENEPDDLPPPPSGPPPVIDHKPQPTPAEPTKPPVVHTPTEPTKPPVKPVVVTPQPPTKPETPPVKPVVDLFTFLPLTWEKLTKSASAWTQMVYDIITKEEPFLLGQNVARDVETFCPTYRKLGEKQRLNFWGQFFSSLAYYESGWNPTSQYLESNMTYLDSVTKRPVVSEGLLQLSYQDEKSYDLDCGFDWEIDKWLKPKDPKKTIFNPRLNLRCGIKIMVSQLKRHGAITLKSSVYWAVLKVDGHYSKINEIAKTTKSLSICK